LETIAVIPFIALLSGVLAQLVLGAMVSRLWKGRLAFLFSLVAFGSVLALIPAVQGGQAVDFKLFEWDRGIALAFHVDGLSVIFGLMGAGIGAAILFYSSQYMAHEEEGATRFYALMLVFIGGLVGLVFSANLLVSYLCWEVIGLCSYFWWVSGTSARKLRQGRARCW